jgi:hypothetical protein
MIRLRSFGGIVQQTEKASSFGRLWYSYTMVGTGGAGNIATHRRGAPRTKFHEFDNVTYYIEISNVSRMTAVVLFGL